jgi:hypothetical protein
VRQCIQDCNIPVLWCDVISGYSRPSELCGGNQSTRMSRHGGQGNFAQLLTGSGAELQLWVIGDLGSVISSHRGLGWIHSLGRIFSNFGVKSAHFNVGFKVYNYLRSTFVLQIPCLVEIAGEFKCKQAASNKHWME